MVPALFLAAMLGLALCRPASADEPPAADEARLPRGLKPALEYDSAAFANLGGGVHPGGTYTSNLNLQLNLDAAALFGWPDTIAYVDALWLQGGLPSNFIGDAQGVSNISAPNDVKIYEAWVQKNFLGNRVSVLAGLYDLNSEFYRLAVCRIVPQQLIWHRPGIFPEWCRRALDLSRYLRRHAHSLQTRARRGHSHRGAGRRSA